MAVVLLFVFGAAAGTGGCAGRQRTGESAAEALEKPQALYDRLDIPAQSLSGMTQRFVVVVRNPGALPLAVSGADVDLEVGGLKAFSGQKPLSATVPPASQAEVEFDVQVAFPDALDELTRFLAPDDGRYVLGGKLHTSGDDLPFAGEGDIPLPKLPSVIVAGSSISRDSKNQYGLTFDIEVKNPNPRFKVHVRKIKYNLAVNAKPVGGDELVVEDNIAFPGIAYTVNAVINDSNLGPKDLQAIVNAKSLHYALTGTLETDEFDIPLSAEGDLKFSR